MFEVGGQGGWCTGLLGVRDTDLRAALPAHPPSSTRWRTIWKRWPGTCCSSAWPWRILRRWDCKVQGPGWKGVLRSSPPPSPPYPCRESGFPMVQGKTLAIVPHFIVGSLIGKNSKRETHAKYSEQCMAGSTRSKPPAAGEAQEWSGDFWSES